MKTEQLLTLFLIVLFFLYSCKDKPDPECIPDPIPNDYVEPEHLWMNRHEIGDTLLFNRYHVDTTADGTRKYRYTGQEQYIATDTGTVQILGKKEVYNDISCNDKIYRNTPFINLKGERKLRLELKPQDSFDWLNIFFSGFEFRIDNDQYNYPGNFYPKLTIEGKEYLRVNTFPGFIEGNWAYPEAHIDSTDAFYNYDYGLLKFIINDTLVLQRIITE